MSYAARPLAERFWEKVDKSGDCWVWTGARQSFGYGIFMLTKGRFDRAHRVSYRLAFGEIPDGQFVLHRCDNPACVNPLHLFTGSQRDNMRDMKDKGRAATGDRLRHGPQVGSLNHGAKLTERVVSEFKKRLAAGELRANVYRELGVTRANAWAIVHGKSWTHV